jgi:hypothetical protein
MHERKHDSSATATDSSTTVIYAESRKQEKSGEEMRNLNTVGGWVGGRGGVVVVVGWGRA